MIGEKIRETRLAQQRSLADVARKARISVATLSRIENDKQTLDVGTLLTLSRVLKTAPNDLLGGGGGNGAPGGDGIDPLVRQIEQLEPKRRTELWRELAANSRSEKMTRRPQADQLATHVEELLAQMELLRQELETVRKRLRRR